MSFASSAHFSLLVVAKAPETGTGTEAEIEISDQQRRLPSQAIATFQAGPRGATRLGHPSPQMTTLPFPTPFTTPALKIMRIPPRCQQRYQYQQGTTTHSRPSPSSRRCATSRARSHNSRPRGAISNQPPSEDSCTITRGSPAMNSIEMLLETRLAPCNTQTGFNSSCGLQLPVGDKHLSVESTKKLATLLWILEQKGLFDKVCAPRRASSGWCQSVSQSSRAVMTCSEDHSQDPRNRTLAHYVPQHYASLPPASRVQRDPIGLMPSVLSATSRLSTGTWGGGTTRRDTWNMPWTADNGLAAFLNSASCYVLIYMFAYSESKLVTLLTCCLQYCGSKPPLLDLEPTHHTTIQHSQQHVYRNATVVVAFDLEATHHTALQYSQQHVYRNATVVVAFDLEPTHHTALQYSQQHVHRNATIVSSSGGP